MPRVILCIVELRADVPERSLIRIQFAGDGVLDMMGIRSLSDALYDAASKPQCGSTLTLLLESFQLPTINEVSDCLPPARDGSNGGTVLPRYLDDFGHLSVFIYVAP